MGLLTLTILLLIGECLCNHSHGDTRPCKQFAGKRCDECKDDYKLEAAEYTITVKMGAGSNDGTVGTQYVKILGTEGESHELRCNADFDVTDQEVECKIKSFQDIGNFMCLVWRSTSDDEWAFTQLKVKIDDRTPWILTQDTTLNNTETKTFCPTGWKPVRPNEAEDFDLESNSLEIRTLNKIGSDEKVLIDFRTEDGGLTGGIVFLFQGSTVKYQVLFCEAGWTYTDFPFTLYSSTKNIWKITLKRTSASSLSLVINNHGAETERFISEDACYSWNPHHWNPVKKIAVIPVSGATAPDFYRAGREEKRERSTWRCVPDPVDATLGEWSTWSAWSSVNSENCGPSSATGYYKERARSRSCNDDNVNTFGKSCDHYSTEETETKWFDNCKKLTGVYLDLYNSYHGGMDCLLRDCAIYYNLHQGSISCSTDYVFWNPDDDDEMYTCCGASKNHCGCHATFDVEKDVVVYMISNSSNDVYLVYLGVTIGKQHKTFYVPGWNSDGYIEVDYSKNHGPYRCYDTSVTTSMCT